MYVIVSIGKKMMSETGYTLDVTWEQVDDLNRSLERREAGQGIAVFEHDADKDVAMIRDRIRSFEQVLDYYGEKV